ncbi:MAG: hypothetical protein HeimC3_30610 [Candidatus Heimdallarchaeota archaeon LC_3]|nr:MAG: hypothetical protein HeimC3_30610 [Candidatus Heimdallarchaeota archaeon LC_3]
MLFKYEFIRLNDTNSSQVKNYISPQEIDLKINSIPILGLLTNNLPLDQNLVVFSSNESITFNFSQNVIYHSVNMGRLN